MRNALALATACLIFTGAAVQAVDLTAGKIAKFGNKAGAVKDKALVKFVKDPAIVAPLPDPTCPGTSAYRLITNRHDTGSDRPQLHELENRRLERFQVSRSGTLRRRLEDRQAQGDLVRRPAAAQVEGLQLRTNRNRRTGRLRRGPSHHRRHGILRSLRVPAFRREEERARKGHLQRPFDGLRSAPDSDLDAFADRHSAAARVVHTDRRPRPSRRPRPTPSR